MIGGRVIRIGSKSMINEVVELENGDIIYCKDDGRMYVRDEDSRLILIADGTENDIKFDYSLVAELLTFVNDVVHNYNNMGYNTDWARSILDKLKVYGGYAYNEDVRD